jgi:hypothetical protein
MPNKPKDAQKRHIQLGQRLEWNGQWCFDEEPGELLKPDGLKVEVLSKEQIAPNGQRVYLCRVYEGPKEYISLNFYINEDNLGETV